MPSHSALAASISAVSFVWKALCARISFAESGVRAHGRRPVHRRTRRYRRGRGCAARHNIRAGFLGFEVQWSTASASTSAAEDNRLTSQQPMVSTAAAVAVRPLRSEGARSAPVRCAWRSGPGQSHSLIETSAPPLKRRRCSALPPIPADSCLPERGTTRRADSSH